MIAIEQVFALGTIGMAAGTAVFGYGLLRGGAAERTFYALLLAISGIATLAYALLFLGVGWVEVGDGRLVFLPRYADWLLTTPLLLVFLGLTVGARSRLLAQLVALDLVAIGAGTGAAFSTGGQKWALFAVAAVAYVGLLALVFGQLNDRASDATLGRERLYANLRNLTIVLWSVYPLVWLLGPSGLGLLTPLVDVLLVAYLDLTTKVGFGLIALDAVGAVRDDAEERLLPAGGLDLGRAGPEPAAEGLGGDRRE